MEEVLSYRQKSKKRLLASLIITLVVMVLEFIVGFLSNSMALIGDGGHMFTHAIAIGIGLTAVVISARPPCHHRTFGLYRAEILAAFINGLFILLVAFVIIYESVDRLLHPEPVKGYQMLLVALIGLVTNIVSILILSDVRKGDLNVKGVFIHMVFDAASSVGVVLAGVGIIFWDLIILDPIISLIIAMAIIYWAYGILKQSTNILLEGSPEGMEVDAIQKEITEKFREVEAIYNVHVWTITTGMVFFSAHITLRTDCAGYVERERIVDRINEHVKKKYGIVESTIQVDETGRERVCTLK